MMLREASPSDSYTSDHCCFSSRDDLQSDWKNCNDSAWSCPRDWRLSASWGLIRIPPENPRTLWHYGIEGLRGVLKSAQTMQRGFPVGKLVYIFLILDLTEIISLNDNIVSDGVRGWEQVVGVSSSWSMIFMFCGNTLRCTHQFYFFNMKL